MDAKVAKVQAFHIPEEFLARYEAERAELAKLLTPEAFRRFEEAETQAAVDFVRGRSA
jgi:hypothetical protein